MNIGTLYALLDVDAGKLLPNIVKEGEAAGEAAGKSITSSIASTLKANLGKAAGGVIGAAFVGAAGGAARLVDQMRTINTVAKLSEDGLNSLKQEVIDLSKESGKST